MVTYNGLLFGFYLETEQIMLQIIFIQQEVELTYDNLRWHDRDNVIVYLV